MKENAFDLHVLGTPPAFVLSQNQTLRWKNEVVDDPGLWLLANHSPRGGVVQADESETIWLSNSARNRWFLTLLYKYLVSVQDHNHSRTVVVLVLWWWTIRMLFITLVRYWVFKQQTAFSTLATYWPVFRIGHSHFFVLPAWATLLVYRASFLCVNSVFRVVSHSGL